MDSSTKGHAEQREIPVPVLLVTTDIGPYHREQNPIISLDLAIGRGMVGGCSGLGDLERFAECTKQIALKICSLNFRFAFNHVSRWGRGLDINNSSQDMIGGEGGGRMDSTSY